MPLTPYHDRDPHARWIFDHCPECGERKTMRATDKMCGACQDGEAPRLDRAKKPALDVLVETAKASFGRAELEYLADRFQEAASEIGRKT